MFKTFSYKGLFVLALLDTNSIKKNTWLQVIQRAVYLLDLFKLVKMLMNVQLIMVTVNRLDIGSSQVHPVGIGLMGSIKPINFQSCVFEPILF